MIASAWTRAPLRDVLVDIQTGFASGRHNVAGVGVAHIRPMNVTSDGRIDLTVVKFVDAALADGPTRHLRRGDVVFNNTNSPELVGKTALFAGDDRPAFSNHMTRLRTDPERLDPSFLALRLHTAWREGWFAAHCNNHVSQASVGRDVLGSFELDLPPLKVQEQIVAVFHSVDKRQELCATHLARADRLVNQCRQSVVASACDGRLTADWRERDLEIRTDGVAERILDGRYSTDLPEGWGVTELGEVLQSIKYGTSQRCDYAAKGVPVLRIPNVSTGELDVRDLKYADLPPAEAAQLALHLGDLLLIRSNGSVELLGRAVEVTEEAVGMAFAGYLIRLRVNQSRITPTFLRLVLSSPAVRRQIEMPARSTSGVNNINTAEISRLSVPLPPVREQLEIVLRAHLLVQHADIVRARVNDSREDIAAASRSFVTGAFRNDPPGAVG